MARLFTAIELTAPVRAAVVRAQFAVADAALAPHVPRPRLVRPADLHLTVAFLGDVPDENMAVVADVVSRGFELRPFTIAFADCGIFPPRGRARVLWLGVSEQTGSLERLRRTLVERFAQAGVGIDGDRWLPHLTIGRWRNDGPRTLRLPAIGVVAEQVVSDVVLFRSELRPDGPVHTALAHGRLSPPNVPVHYTDSTC
jgi:2'-5' RNA ligase